MHIYNKLNINLQNKIDYFINKINKNIFKNKLNNQITSFSKLKLQWLYFKYYDDLFEMYPKLCLGFDIILNNILFWLNDPYSKQLDTPFMSGLITDNCKKIIKKINPNIEINLPFDDDGIYLNYDILKYFFKNNQIKLKNNKIDTKHIILNILNTLSINQLEDLYIYTINQIKKYPNKNIVYITLKFNKKYTVFT